MGNNKIKRIEELVRIRGELKKTVNDLDNKIYKLENEYLELTQGANLLKNLEFYIHTKPEKKKTRIEEEDRVFSFNYPTQKKYF